MILRDYNHTQCGKQASQYSTAPMTNKKSEASCLASLLKFYSVPLLIQKLQLHDGLLVREHYLLFQQASRFHHGYQF